MSILVSTDPISIATSICADCGKKTDASSSSYDFEEKIICDDCDAYYQWCNICQTSNSSEMCNPCRHLFFSNDGEWAGFGAYKDDLDAGREPFLAMLKMAGTDFAVDLKRSLSAHKYYFQFRGSIFRVEEIFVQLLQENGKMSWEYNSPINLIFQEENEEKQEIAATGISWLMSLWSGSSEDKWQTPETIEGDLLAASWCEEFLGEGKLSGQMISPWTKNSLPQNRVQ